MALGDSYATLSELKSRIGIGTSDTADDARLTAALAVASRGIEKVCQRQFNDAGSASARKYRACVGDYIDVDDFSTVTGLVVATDEDDDGTFETTWASSDYELEPINGVMDGETGWPYFQIWSVADRVFPTGGLRSAVQVTARWGWTAVPSPIKEAALIIGSETFKLKDAPFGVAGFTEFGAVRVRQNPIVMAMIAPYKRDAVLVG